MEMTEDEWQDQRLNKYLNEQEMNEMVSVCCGEAVYENSDGDDVCFQCQETCETISLGDYKYNEYENAECDKADANKELERER